MATLSIKCPNCGGGLQFDPASQNYECEYCLSKFTQEELEKIAPEIKGEEKDKQAIDRDIVSCSRDYVGSDDGCFLSYF